MDRTPVSFNFPSRRGLAATGLIPSSVTPTGSSRAHMKSTVLQKSTQASSKSTDTTNPNDRIATQDSPAQMNDSRFWSEGGKYPIGESPTEQWARLVLAPSIIIGIPRAANQSISRSHPMSNNQPAPKYQTAPKDQPTLNTPEKQPSLETITWQKAVRMGQFPDSLQDMIRAERAKAAVKEEVLKKKWSLYAARLRANQEQTPKAVADWIKKLAEQNKALPKKPSWIGMEWRKGKDSMDTGK